MSFRDQTTTTTRVKVLTLCDLLPLLLTSRGGISQKTTRQNGGKRDKSKHFTSQQHLFPALALRGR